MITPQSLIIRNDQQFLTSELSNELLMMNLDTGNYILLNEVSADVWKLLEQPLRAESIVDKLVDIYTISKEDCLQKTFLFLKEMADNELVSVR
ncbi:MULTISPECIES: PqqD family protein [Emticicia]|uniref:PqqD family protein n=1 Tax=Emticicia TaxID=312278 RepID=UPI00209C81B6|nr:MULTISPECIES: PqqD family protein [Emticicia]UTA66963.1 PqqD family peptide modification chaperone [Emticicia sp. 21SJ11W-3]